tara:strand:+ start:324 stop:587 length:264 start_codon:yes stop_codon:yes gene_type:complete
MSILLLLKEGGSIAIDTIGNKPIDEDLNITDLLKFILFDGSTDTISVANNSLKFIESDGSVNNISTFGGILKFTESDGTIDSINLIK